MASYVDHVTGNQSLKLLEITEKTFFCKLPVITGKNKTNFHYYKFCQDSDAKNRLSRYKWGSIKNNCINFNFYLGDFSHGITQTNIVVLLHKIHLRENIDYQLVSDLLKF